MARRSKENAIDWEAIERQYRLGTKSNKQLAEEYGVEPSSIGRRAKSHGWIQDKAKDVEVTRNSLLIQASSGNANPNATPNATEIKVAAQASADVVLSHRVSLKRQAAIEEKLFQHLEAAIDKMGSIEELFDFIRASTKDDPLAFSHAVKLLSKLAERSDLIEDFKKLVEASDKRRKGEREAFGIKDVEEGDKDVDTLLIKLRKLKNGITQ